MSSPAQSTPDTAAVVLVRTTPEGPAHPELLSPPLDLTSPSSLGRVGNYRQLAIALGKDRSHISRAMRGRAGVSRENLRDMAEALGLTADELIGHMDAMARVPLGEICKCGHHTSAHKVTRQPATVQGKALEIIHLGKCEACQCGGFGLPKPRKAKAEDADSEVATP